MITNASYPVEPWAVREETLRPELLAQAESVFALSNGHIGWRANLDEGEPHGLLGSYLNGVHEIRPLPYAEAGYGYPESGQTVINITDGKVIRLLVDDEPLDIRYGDLVNHERELDLRAGVLRRHVQWVSPAGKAVHVTSTRLVSFTQRSIAAICYDVEAVDQTIRLVIQSELVANEEQPGQSADPRAATVLDHPLCAEEHSVTGTRVNLIHTVRQSGIRVAAAMDHVLVEPNGGKLAAESAPDLGRVSVTSVLRPGQRLRLIKFVAYGWSSQRTMPALRAQVDAALTAATATGWDGLLAEQREFLDEFWANADVEVDGDTQVQQAVRFGLFHVLQAGARSERRAIPAKGLTGPGYDGHSFWDSEMFVLPVLTYTFPEATAHALSWRYDTLPLALDRAQQLGLQGSAFPWRTITGAECSGYWPAGTAAFHINAAVANAVVQYVNASHDQDFAATVGIELLVQTARLWRSLGHHDAEGRFNIDGVTGPDEYSAVADNNVYTNLMAKRNLLAAADYVHRFPERAKELGVDDEEAAAWRDAAREMVIPYDDKLGVHQQAEGFTRHQVWNFEATPEDSYPLLLHFPYFDLYRKQVVKQADLVLAIMQCPDEFTADQKARDFAYYEAVTVRDSSLSACIQSVVAAEVGHLELAHDYLAEAALMDLEDLEHNTSDGVHMASLAGAWIALVSGFGGMRQHNGQLGFSPRLSPALSRLAFTLRLDKGSLRVEISRNSARYTLRDHGPLHITHHGKKATIESGKPVDLPISSLPKRPAPIQPSGRAPHRHTPMSHETHKGNPE